MKPFKRYLLLATLFVAVCCQNVECTWNGALDVKVPKLKLVFHVIQADCRHKSAANSLTPVQHLKSLLPGWSMKEFYAAGDAVWANVRIAF